MKISCSHSQVIHYGPDCNNVKRQWLKAMAYRVFALVVFFQSNTVQDTKYGNRYILLPTVHSKKFKMNDEVDSFLSEKVSNLLLT